MGLNLGDQRGLQTSSKRKLGGARGRTGDAGVLRSPRSSGRLKHGGGRTQGKVGGSFTPSQKGWGPFPEWVFLRQMKMVTRTGIQVAKARGVRHCTVRQIIPARGPAPPPVRPPEVPPNSVCSTSALLCKSLITF